MARKHHRREITDNLGLTDSVSLEIATSEDVRQGVNAALAEVGLTLPEIRQQALIGKFSSERVRLVWSAIREVAAV